MLESLRCHLSGGTYRPPLVEKANSVQTVVTSLKNKRSLETSANGLPARAASPDPRPRLRRTCRRESPSQVSGNPQLVLDKRCTLLLAFSFEIMALLIHLVACKIILPKNCPGQHKRCAGNARTWLGGANVCTASRRDTTSKTGRKLVLFWARRFWENVCAAGKENALFQLSSLLLGSKQSTIYADLCSLMLFTGSAAASPEKVIVLPCANGTRCMFNLLPRRLTRGFSPLIAKP